MTDAPQIRHVPVAELATYLAQPTDRPRILVSARCPEVKEWLAANNVPFMAARNFPDVMVALETHEQLTLVPESLMLYGWCTNQPFEAVMFTPIRTNTEEGQHAKHIQIVHRCRDKPSDYVVVVDGHSWVKAS